MREAKYRLGALTLPAAFAGLLLAACEGEQETREVIRPIKATFGYRLATAR